MGKVLSTLPATEMSSNRSARAGGDSPVVFRRMYVGIPVGRRNHVRKTQNQTAGGASKLTLNWPTGGLFEVKSGLSGKSSSEVDGAET